MTRAADHSDQCEWHHDQYPWECGCGAIANPDQFRPKWLKAPVEPDQQITTSEKEQ